MPERLIHCSNSALGTSAAPTTTLDAREEALWNLLLRILQVCSHRDLSSPNPDPRNQQDCRVRQEHAQGHGDEN